MSRNLLDDTDYYSWLVPQTRANATASAQSRGYDPEDPAAQQMVNGTMDDLQDDRNDAMSSLMSSRRSSYLAAQPGIQEKEAARQRGITAALNQQYGNQDSHVIGGGGVVSPDTGDNGAGKDYYAALTGRTGGTPAASSSVIPEATRDYMSDTLNGAAAHSAYTATMAKVPGVSYNAPAVHTQPVQNDYLTRLNAANQAAAARQQSATDQYKEQLSLQDAASEKKRNRLRSGLSEAIPALLKGNALGIEEAYSMYPELFGVLPVKFGSTAHL